MSTSPLSHDALPLALLPIDRLQQMPQTPLGMTRVTDAPRAKGRPSSTSAPRNPGVDAREQTRTRRARILRVGKQLLLRIHWRLSPVADGRLGPWAVAMVGVVCVIVLVGRLPGADLQVAARRLGQGGLADQSGGRAPGRGRVGAVRSGVHGAVDDGVGEGSGLFAGRIPSRSTSRLAGSCGTRRVVSRYLVGGGSAPGSGPGPSHGSIRARVRGLPGRTSPDLLGEFRG